MAGEVEVTFVKVAVSDDGRFRKFADYVRLRM